VVDLEQVYGKGIASGRANSHALGNTEMTIASVLVERVDAVHSALHICESSGGAGQPALLFAHSIFSISAAHYNQVKGLSEYIGTARGTFMGIDSIVI